MVMMMVLMMIFMYALCEDKEFQHQEEIGLTDRTR